MLSFMKSINITSRCATQYRSDLLDGTGLNGCQCTYILNVCRNAGISQEKLSKLVYINKSNVTRQLAILEQNGFVERKCSDIDKRVVEVYPTQKAADIYPKLIDIMKAWNNYLTDGFTADERDILSSLLERVTEKAAAYMESGSIL